MSNPPKKVAYYLERSAPQLKDYIRRSDDEALHDLLARNRHNEEVIFLTIDELARADEPVDCHPTYPSPAGTL